MDDMEVIVFEDLPSEKTPIDADNLNKMQENAKKAIKNRKPTIELLTVSSTAPSTCAVGDKYYNTTTSKIYTAIATNTWGTTGENPSNLYLYVDLEHKELYYFDGTRFVSYGGGSGGTGGDTVPIGSIVPFASDTIPNGWLLCDGSAVSRTTYSELFAIIGTAHGIGDGSTTFNVPNIKGKVVVGKQQTMTPSGNFTNLGETGGEEDHTLTVDEIPSHGHDVAIAVNNTVPGGARYYFNSAGTTSAPISDTAAWSNSLTAKATGGGQAHNNLQPYIVENYIIKAKNTAVVKGDVIQENGTASTTNVYSAKAIDNKLKTNIITGQEVATNEYIDGKRVYLKRATFTTPNAVDIWKTMITIPANSEIVNSYQVYETESNKYPFPFSYNNESMQIYYNSNNGTINVKTSFNYALNKYGYIIVKYTKNT